MRLITPGKKQKNRRRKNKQNLQIGPAAARRAEKDLRKNAAKRSDAQQINVPLGMRSIPKLVAETPVPGPRNRYFLYAIELDSSVQADHRHAQINDAGNSYCGYLYVGQSNYVPEECYSRYVSGAKSSEIVRKYGRGISPLAHNGGGPFATKAEAEMALASLIERLRTQGYAVWNAALKRADPQKRKPTRTRMRMYRDV